MCRPTGTCSCVLRFEYCVSPFFLPLVLVIVLTLLLVVLVFSLCNSLFSTSVPRRPLLHLLPPLLPFALITQRTCPKPNSICLLRPALFYEYLTLKIKHNASGHALHQFHGSPCCVVVSSSSSVHGLLVVRTTQMSVITPFMCVGSMQRVGILDVAFECGEDVG